MNVTSVDTRRSYQEALALLRREIPERMFRSYLDGDNVAAAERFAQSVEFSETLRELSALGDRKSTPLNSSHIPLSRMPSPA